jgi:hypothetical protein
MLAGSNTLFWPQTVTSSFMVGFSAMSTFEVYVVYWNPKDFPGKFVVRRWGYTKFTPEPKEVIAVGLDLDEVREKIPAGLYRQSREKGDDSAIVEVWL